MNSSRPWPGDTCRISSMNWGGLCFQASGMSSARTPASTTYWRRLMTLRMRDMAAALGLFVLGFLALPPIGCGTNSTDQGGAGGRLDPGSPQGGSNVSTGTGGATGGQGGSNAAIGTGGATGGSSGSGTGSGVETGYSCSGGGGESGTGTTVPRSCFPYASGSFYCNAGVCGCYYNRVTGCLCADNTVSPCKPLDPTCTAATAGGTASIGLGTADPKTNLSCNCDSIGYWWCS